MNEKNQNMREICSCDKRYSKTCPIEIGRSVLYFDDEAASYTVICSLTNAISDTGADSVASAVLVIRAHRVDGSDITFMGKEYVAKALNFTKEGLCVGNSSGNLAFKLDIDDASVAKLEIYVTKIVFVSGVVALFQRNEFYELPNADTLIKHAFLHKSVKQFVEKFGESSKYVPQKLSPLMWRCSCGEICVDFICPKCSADKKEMLEFTENALLLKQAFVKKTRVPTIVSLSVAIALLLSLAITLAVLNFKNAPNTPNDHVDLSETSTVQTTQQQDIKQEYDKALAYLNIGMYDEALEVAINLNHPTLIDTVLAAASEYYFNEGDYMKAYDYSVRRKNPENIGQIAEAAYTQAMGASMHDKALTYAQKLKDEAKIEESAKAYIVDLKAEQKFEDAYKVAEDNSLEELTQTIASEATAHYISQKEYQKALDFSEKTKDDELIKSTATSAANALVADSKAVEAFDFAVKANDEALIKDVVSNIKTPIL